MMKPLSPKTLSKKYAELGLSETKVDVLRHTFRCAANLYGVIMLRDLWTVFREYEGISFVHKKDFLAFSDVVRREADLPYTIYDIKEVYKDEDSEDPADRLIINNDLITRGFYRFIFAQTVIDGQADKPLYVPDKQTFLSFSEDRFYQTDIGKRISRFIGDLKTNGIGKNYQGEVTGKLVDINGEPIKGKRLADCVFLTSLEKSEVDETVNETQKQKLMGRYAIPASEKILSGLENHLMTGGLFVDDTLASYLGWLFKDLDKSYGVSLSMKQAETLLGLITELNNHSNLWKNNGWRPVDLACLVPVDAEPAITFGPNMQRMFAAGKLDRDEYEKVLIQAGLKVIDKK